MLVKLYAEREFEKLIFVFLNQLSISYNGFIHINGSMQGSSYSLSSLKTP